MREEKGLNHSSDLLSVPIKVKCLTCKDNNVYAFPEEYNQLYVMDLQNHSIESLGCIPWENKNGNRLYEMIVSNDDTLFFVPFNAYYLSYYSISTHEFGKIDIRDNNRIKGVFSNGFIIGDFIYLIGGSASAILRIDYKSKTITELNDWVKDIDDNVFDITDGFFRSQGVFCSDYFVTPFCNANALLMFDYKQMKYSIHNLGSDNNGYSGIIKQGDCYWLAPRKGGMYAIKCDENFNVLDRYNVSKGFFAGIDIVDGCPTLYTSGSMDSRIGAIKILGNKERIAVENNYIAHCDLNNYCLTINGEKGEIFCGVVETNTDDDAWMDWCVENRNKNISYEKSGDTLKMFIKSIMY